MSPVQNVTHVPGLDRYESIGEALRSKYPGTWKFWPVPPSFGQHGDPFDAGTGNVEACESVTVGMRIRLFVNDGTQWYGKKRYSLFLIYEDAPYWDARRKREAVESVEARARGL
jgi:hypothetical protein